MLRILRHILLLAVGFSVSALSASNPWFETKLCATCKLPLFNRYTIVYTADTPVQGKLTYRVGGKTVTDVFYLEPSAAPAQFNAVIDGFLDGKLGWQFVDFSYTPNRSDKTFRIDRPLFSRVPVPEKSLFLEDSFCSAGITLAMGGGIESFAWKAAPAGFTNLLNRCDEGRLVQQSYYGTEQEAYTNGTFMGNSWTYNPVQGGDQFRNRSKLVDYKMDGNSIYVKCRPMDWSKNGELTPSYMENTYTLKNGVLQVDNRFVDFSGLVNQARHQEMPAFYCVRALDTFRYYDSGALQTKENLPFWAENPNCYFELADKDTAWFAWTQGNANDAFGIGVYAPGTEIMLAGRVGDNPTVDPTANETSYCAPLRVLALQSYVPLSYTYYLTAGTLPQLANAFSK